MFVSCLKFVFTCLAVLTLSGGVSAASDETKTIRIIQNDWVSQRVNALIIGDLLKELGYRTEFIEYAVDMQWAALRRGQGHIQVEIWQDSMEMPFTTYVGQNHILDVGTHKAVSREEWWYPMYVKAMCPGLPDWRALLDCYSIFADEKSNGKGVYINGPWYFDDGALIRGLGLKFEVRQVSDDKALWKLLAEASEKRKPILMINWTPNWTDSEIPGEFVEFPDYHPDCHINPEWGINKTISHDCGNPEQGWIRKAAWVGLPEYAPCATELLKNMSLTSEMISDAANWVMSDGLSEREAANKWLKKYQSESDGWLPNCKSETGH